MSTISLDDVRKLARLARLKLSEDEIAAYAKQLPQILDYVAQLQQVDVEGVQPTNQVSGLSNVTRVDEVVPGVAPAELLKNAPALVANQFKVKRMIV